MIVPFLVVRSHTQGRFQPEAVVSRHSTRKKAAGAAKRHAFRGLMPSAYVIDSRPQPHAYGLDTRLRPRVAVVRAYHG